MGLDVPPWWAVIPGNMDLQVQGCLVGEELTDDRSTDD
jgi:hypothetical protein